MKPGRPRKQDEDGIEEGESYDLGAIVKRIGDLEQGYDKIMDSFLELEKKFNSIKSNDSVTKLTEVLEKFSSKQEVPKSLVGEDIEEEEKFLREQEKSKDVKVNHKELYKEIRGILAESPMDIAKITTTLRKKGILKGVEFIIANKAVRDIIVRDPGVKMIGTTAMIIEG